MKRKLSSFWLFDVHIPKSYCLLGKNNNNNNKKRKVTNSSLKKKFLLYKNKLHLFVSVNKLCILYISLYSSLQIQFDFIILFFLFQFNRNSIMAFTAGSTYTKRKRLGCAFFINISRYNGTETANRQRRYKRRFV